MSAVLTLELSGQPVDLPENAKIALTLQVNDLAELKDRQASFSTRFTLPPTTKNARLLGFPDLVNASHPAPYRRIPARLLQDGVQLLPHAVAVVEDASAEGYNLSILAGIYDFFSALEDKTIQDLDLSDLTHVWNRANVKNSQENTSGYTYPVIQYGKTPATGSTVDIRDIKPAVYFHTLIERIAASVGYTLEGEVLEDNIYQRLLVPSVKSDLVDAEQLAADRSFKAAKGSNGVIPTGRVKFDNTDGSVADSYLGAAQLYNPSTGVYTAQGYQRVSVEVSYPVSLEAVNRIDKNRRQPIFRLNKNGNRVAQGFALTKSFTAQVDLAPGDWLEVVMTSPSYQVTLKQGAFFEVQVQQDNGLNAELDMAWLMPDIKQGDLLKTFARLYGLIFQADTDRQVLRLRRMEEIDRPDAATLDWTDRMDLTNPPELEFRLGDYAQENLLRWREDEEGFETLGEGFLYVDDQTLERRAELFSLPFAASRTTKVLSDVETADIPFYDEEGRASLRPKPRLLIARQRSKSVTFTDGLNNSTASTITVATFSSPQFGEGLSYEADLIPAHYQTLARLLDRTKVVRVKLRLSAADIQSLDFLRPVYLGPLGGRFYLNKIKNWQPDRSVDCELLRL